MKSNLLMLDQLDQLQPQRTKAFKSMKYEQIEDK